MVGPYVVIGEGDRDEAFLRHLCVRRTITGLVFDFAGGNGGFGQRLLAMSTDPKFQSCKAILIVTDTDELDDGCFGLIRDQLKEIDFPIPTRPLEIASKQNRPSIAVLMLPHPPQGPDGSGCLETLLIPAMEAAYPMQAHCVNEMMRCAGITAWNRRDERDKFKIRCLTSSALPHNPMCGLHLCFSGDNHVIPLDSNVFNEVALMLEHFAAWSGSNIKSWADWRTANNI